MAITVREIERGSIEPEETYYYSIPKNVSIEPNYTNAQEAGARMAILVNEQLAQAKEQNEKVLLLLAGGSAFAAYEGINQELLGPHVAIGMADDRYVADPTLSNMEQFQQTALYQRAVAAGSDIIDSRQQYAEPLQAFADRYDRQIMRYVGEKRKIILVLGMGGTGNAEGHVAGIAPGLNPYD
ncbi:MAG: 6-phosphogluconolactonase, partial [Patescibacteria group bacterium]|nr:6-phosphogluconolactonase [Patescibacteria group bacterium]